MRYRDDDIELSWLFDGNNIEHRILLGVRLRGVLGRLVSTGCKALESKLPHVLRKTGGFACNGLGLDGRSLLRLPEGKEHEYIGYQQQEALVQVLACLSRSQVKPVDLPALRTTNSVEPESPVVSVVVGSRKYLPPVPVPVMSVHGRP